MESRIENPPLMICLIRCRTWEGDFRYETDLISRIIRWRQRVVGVVRPFDVTAPVMPLERCVITSKKTNCRFRNKITKAGGGKTPRLLLCLHIDELSDRGKCPLWGNSGHSRHNYRKR
jgi:hypothetical protein